MQILQTTIDKQIQKMTDNQTEDYPFTSWKTFYAAFVECNSTEFYAETYPKLANAIETGESNLQPIMYDLIEKGHDPQEGLDGFIQAMLDGSRYAKDLVEGIFPNMVKEFIAKGAKLNIEPLITPQYDDIEDEMCCGGGSIKGCMLYALKKADVVPDMDEMLNEKLNWKNIFPCCWEYIAYYAHDNHTQFLMALKYDYVYKNSSYSELNSEYSMKLALYLIEHWKEGDTLSFRGCDGLTEIPSLPEGVKKIDCFSLPSLTKLPDTLPSTLKYLNCSNTSITKLPTLPSGLISLDCSDTNITELPNLPDSLEELYISGIRIKTLPDPLPSCLWILDRYSYPYGEPLGKYLCEKKHAETITKYLERISHVV